MAIFLKQTCAHKIPLSVISEDWIGSALIIPGTDYAGWLLMTTWLKLKPRQK